MTRPVIPDDWPTKTEMLIMRILHGGPHLYASEILEKSASKVSRAAVYVLLRRLKLMGYVHGECPKESMHHGEPRPIFKLTAIGRRVIKAADDIGLNI